MVVERLGEHLILYAAKIAPMELRLVRDAFDDPAYVFGLKHDGDDRHINRQKSLEGNITLRASPESL